MTGPTHARERVSAWPALAAAAMQVYLLSHRPETRDVDVAWRFQGTYFENRSCAMTCPCTHSGFSMPADYERCRAPLALYIDAGDVDGVDVSGLGFAMFIYTPPGMADGNWRLWLFLDATGSAEQGYKPGVVLSDGLGGPSAMRGPLIGEMRGVEAMPVGSTNDGRRHQVRIGNEIDVEVEDHVPPGIEAGPVQLMRNIVHPANDTLTLATGDQVAGLGVRDGAGGEGQSAFSAPCAWLA
jgi:hypothetical protein